jgi:hypothetical protein
VVINIEQLADNVLTTPNENCYAPIQQLLYAVQQASPAVLKPLENTLPEFAAYLYDPDDNGTGKITLKLFRYCQINKRTVDRLVELQQAQPDKLVLSAFGMSDPCLWDSKCVVMLARALATDETASTAAEILFRHSGAFNSALAIEALQYLAQCAQTQPRSEAISKLISHTEGTQGLKACQCLEKILQSADQTIRIEIAAKLAWTNNRGLDLLKITAADKHPDVRLASAKALSQGYRFRGKRVLAALSRDDDPQVRRFAASVLA